MTGIDPLVAPAAPGAARFRSSGSRTPLLSVSRGSFRKRAKNAAERTTEAAIACGSEHYCGEMDWTDEETIRAIQPGLEEGDSWWRSSGSDPFAGHEFSNKLTNQLSSYALHSLWESTIGRGKFLHRLRSRCRESHRHSGRTSSPASTRFGRR